MKTNKQTVIGSATQRHLESNSELFSSLERRSVSPRRIPVNELPNHGLRRFVRVERTDQSLPAAGDFPRTAKSLHRLDEQTARLENSQEVNKEVVQTIKELSRIKSDLNIAAGLVNDDERDSEIKQEHRGSSWGSPYISGTTTFTWGGNHGQADFIDRSRDPSTVTISHTDRAIPNPFNLLEREQLLPVAQHKRELAGTYTVHPNGKSTYVDTSGDSPRTYHDEEANKMFRERAGKIYLYSGQKD